MSSFSSSVCFKRASRPYSANCWLGDIAKKCAVSRPIIVTQRYSEAPKIIGSASLYLSMQISTSFAELYSTIDILEKLIIVSLTISLSALGLSVIMQHNKKVQLFWGVLMQIPPLISKTFHMFHTFHQSIPTPTRITNHSPQKRLCRSS